jgi:arylsulfatase
VHAAPWDRIPRAALADDRWELYDAAHDFSLAHDLAGERPDKLAELLGIWQTEAERLHVLPLDDRRDERLDATLAGRPDPMGRRHKVVLGPEVVGLPEAVFLPTRDRDLTITAHVRVPEGGAEGPILVDGGRFAGWALHLDHGRPAFTYAWVGSSKASWMGDDPLSPGKHTLVFHLEVDGPGGGAEGTLLADGKSVSTGRIEHVNRGPTGETVDVGVDLGMPVSEAYARRPRFTGQIDDVVVEVGAPKEAVQTASSE